MKRILLAGAAAVLILTGCGPSGPDPTAGKTPNEIDRCIQWASDAAYYGRQDPRGQMAALNYVSHHCDGI